MTIRETKKKLDFDDIEVYADKGRGTFHTDNIKDVDDVPENTRVVAWELMDEDTYNQTILANTCVTADFEDWYGNKEAKVLCILIREGE